ncbi:Pentatricopeptide repeat-containing protein [Thalictrum thalictroides]|uniref:Pentatricopeptide repeat-containing protein n=1 Tax=Thalictrum thalictroides TaxID=46969 RepID=A0A7J6X3D9_THATH|nr:Pentatricopeptide repeat-containing protein [Thalictrum thalictroides]
MKADIRKLVFNGLYKEALSLCTQLHKTHSVYPNNFTYPFLFKACGKLKSFPQAFSLHAICVKTGFDKEVHTATALTDMYMKFHRLKDSYQVFDEMPERNIVSVNTIISGLAQNGYFGDALVAFRIVCLGGLRPNSVSVASVLSGCEILKHGLEVHGFAVKLGVEMDVYVATALLTMYSKCGEIVSALEMFKLMPDKNLVSYNALLSVLLQSGMGNRVFEVFKAMRKSLDERPSSVTWVSVLSACSTLLNIRFGMQVHCLSLKYELGCDVKVGTALVDMYSKCGSWELAYKIFNELEGHRNLFTWNSMISGMFSNGQCESAVLLFKKIESEELVPDSVTWNTMISGFSLWDKGVEAFSYFKKMQLAGLTPTLKSVTSLLPVCSSMSAFQSGKEIHSYAIRSAIDADEFITTSFIDVYMKCGYSYLARRVFDRFSRRSDDPAIWNAMISGYGRNGENENALEIFELMKEDRVQPNSATFTGILSACSHAGKVEKGLELFKTVIKDYGLNPTPEHFGCIVDLLGRAGRLDEAWHLIQEVPHPITSLYSSLLGACRWHFDAELGEEIAEKLSELEPSDPTPLVILSNIYAEQERWGDVERVREVMTHKGLIKLPGYSLIGDTE